MQKRRSSQQRGLRPRVGVPHTEVLPFEYLASSGTMSSASLIGMRAIGQRPPTRAVCARVTDDRRQPGQVSW